MKYLIALIFPPLAILLCGKPFQAILSIPLSCLYFPSALWAILTVANFNADKRSAVQTGTTVEAIRKQTLAMERMAKASAAASKPQSAPIPQSGPQASPSTAPLPTEPKQPWITKDGLISGWATARASLGSAKSEAIRAYHNLPEWAQPITWGLSAGTVLSLIVVTIIAFKRA